MIVSGIRRVLKLLLFEVLEYLKLSTFLWSVFVLLDLHVQFQKEVWLHKSVHNCMHSHRCAQLGTIWGFPECAFIPSSSSCVQMLPERNLAPNIRGSILPFQVWITKCYCSPFLGSVQGFSCSKQGRELPAYFHLPPPPPSLQNFYMCSNCWLDYSFSGTQLYCLNAHPSLLANFKCFTAGVSKPFSLGATVASQLPSKGLM